MVLIMLILVMVMIMWMMMIMTGMIIMVLIATTRDNTTLITRSVRIMITVVAVLMMLSIK